MERGGVERESGGFLPWRFVFLGAGETDRGQLRLGQLTGGGRCDFGVLFAQTWRGCCSAQWWGTESEDPVVLSRVPVCCLCSWIAHACDELRSFKVPCDLVERKSSSKVVRGCEFVRV